MQGLIKGSLIGIASGVVTCFASAPALGYTNAFAMPSWAPAAAWEWIAVLGVGAALVALVTHAVALLVSGARASVALAAFFITLVVALAATGNLEHGAKTLAAWLVGGFLASWIILRLRPAGSFKLLAPGDTA